MVARPIRKEVGFWTRTGLQRAWELSAQREAVQREAELFPNMARERRGYDDVPPSAADGGECEEAATDAGASIDAPADGEVRGGPRGVTLLRAADGDLNTEEAEAAEVAQWHQWELAEADFDSAEGLAAREAEYQSATAAAAAYREPVRRSGRAGQVSLPH